MIGRWAPPRSAGELTVLPRSPMDLGALRLRKGKGGKGEQRKERMTGREGNEGRENRGNGRGEREQERRVSFATSFILLLPRLLSPLLLLSSS